MERDLKNELVSNKYLYSIGIQKNEEIGRMREKKCFVKFGPFQYTPRDGHLASTRPLTNTYKHSLQQQIFFIKSGNTNIGAATCL